MKANFIRKPTEAELAPHDDFVIEKTIILDKDSFNHFLKEPLADWIFISSNCESMFCDSGFIMHCLFITSESHDFGILVESEGYGYARYAAYLPKLLMEEPK